MAFTNCFGGPPSASTCCGQLAGMRNGETPIVAMICRDDCHGHHPLITWETIKDEKNILFSNMLIGSKFGNFMHSEKIYLHLLGALRPGFEASLTSWAMPRSRWWYWQSHQSSSVRRQPVPTRQADSNSPGSRLTPLQVIFPQVGFQLKSFSLTLNAILLFCQGCRQGTCDSSWPWSAQASVHSSCPYANGPLDAVQHLAHKCRINPTPLQVWRCLDKVYPSKWSSKPPKKTWTQHVL